MRSPSAIMRLLVLVFASCGMFGFVGFAEITPQTDKTPNHSVTLQVQTVCDGKPLMYNALTLKNKAGNRFSVSRLAFLLSEIRLIRANGTTLDLGETAGYFNPAEKRDSLTLKQVPSGEYSGLSFRIGLEAKRNHADPSRYAANHPLNPLVNTLHWSWQGGYVFLALEGRYRQASGKLGGYSYHLATDADPMLVTLNQKFRLDHDNHIALRFDAARLFDAIHPIEIRPENGNDSTHSAPGDLLARQLKANAVQAFTLEAIENTNVLHKQPVPSLAKRFGTLYTFPTPQGFPQPNLPLDNPLTYQGIALGERLFFDKRLSGSNTQSCASCHQPKFAFSDGGKATSVGMDGRHGSRNALPLCNLAWRTEFTWDGRQKRLRDQVLAPIQNVNEMHQSLAQAVKKIQRDRQYLSLFTRAFGTRKVTVERIGLAVEQYLYTLISANSKFDKALRGEAQFTDEEKRGLMLFITEYDPARGKEGADCFHCHGGTLFTDNRFANNGAADEKSPDTGRGKITKQAADKGKFLTPALRNIALTAPYFHDGRFKTLEQVIAHYSEGIHWSDTLDPNIAKHPDGGVHLSQEGKKALIAFLHTLTDEAFTCQTPRKLP